MSVNNDSVTRSAYYKYLHPKEVFIADGVLVPDIIRKKVFTSVLEYCFSFYPFKYFRISFNLAVPRKRQTQAERMKAINQITQKIKSFNLFIRMERR